MCPVFKITVLSINLKWCAPSVYVLKCRFAAVLTAPESTTKSPVPLAALSWSVADAIAPSAEMRQLAVLPYAPLYKPDDRMFNAGPEVPNLKNTASSEAAPALRLSEFSAESMSSVAVLK